MGKGEALGFVVAKSARHQCREILVCFTQEQIYRTDPWS